jgi:hypothetical protein
MLYKLTEYEECKIFAEYLHYKKLHFTHIANESGLPPKVAMIISKKKKAIGVSKGFPDYLIIIKREFVFIEMKRHKKNKPARLTEEQKAWGAILNNCKSSSFFVCYGADEAIKIIETKLKNS